MPDPLYRRIRQHAIRRKLASPEVKLTDYKEFMRLENEMLVRYHSKGDSGKRVALARTIMMNVLLESLFQSAISRFEQVHGPVPCSVSLIALGGYGRHELCPASDIDIMFLYPNRNKGKLTDTFKGYIADIVLYMLWDLNLKVGHSTRTPNEAIEEAKGSVESKNSMLEMSFIAGDKKFYEKYEKAYKSFIRKDNAQVYIEERLQAQRSRQEKYGNTIYIQEPDIKNGVGGLRDYQNILWMARLKLDAFDMGDLLHQKLLTDIEYRNFTRAYDFLLRVRNELHFSSKRTTDILTLEKQPAIAWSLGYRRKDIFRRVEVFMRDYYRHTLNIYQISQYLEQKMALSSKTTITFKDVLKSRQYVKEKEIDGFVLSDGKLYASSDRVFKDEPERMIRVFRHAQQFNAELDFNLRRLITKSLPLINASLIQSPSANRSFRSILQTVGSVYYSLELMHRIGVLSRFVPEWRELECLVQHEYYHRYTADEHTLKTIRELDKVFNGEEDPVYAKYRRAVRATKNPKLLYLILFLHDIGKGISIKDHDTKGVIIARPMLKRFGIIPELHDKILFIIQNHLEMARFWQRHDIDDPENLQTFAKKFTNVDLLHYLYVHTFCDAKGTSADMWNGYRDMLHTQLYNNAIATFETSEKTETQIMIPKDIIAERLPELSVDEIEAHYNLLPERYFINSNADEIVLHLKMVNRLLQNISEADSFGSLMPIIEWEDDLSLSMSVVHIVTWDRAGLFSKLAGAFSVAGLSIVSSKAITRADHITIDTFYVCEIGGGVVQNKKNREVFEEMVKKALLEKYDLWPAIVEKARELEKPSYLNTEKRLSAPLPRSVDVYHELRLRRSIIEIQTNDSLGLLYRVSRAIYDNGFDITFARISTEKDVAVDTFYIEKTDKTVEDNSDKLLKLRECLNQIIMNDVTDKATTV